MKLMANSLKRYFFINTLTHKLSHLRKDVSNNLEILQYKFNLMT